MDKRISFVTAVVLCALLITTTASAKAKIKRKKLNEAERFTYASLDLFCKGIEYNPANFSSKGQQFDLVQADQPSKEELRILKNYGFNTVEVYEKILDRYENDPVLAAKKQKIEATPKFQKKYQNCMILSLPPEERAQAEKDFKELGKVSPF